MPSGLRSDASAIENNFSVLRWTFLASDQLWVVRVYRRTGTSVDRLAMHPLDEVAGRRPAMRTGTGIFLITVAVLLSALRAGSPHWLNLHMM